MRKPWKTTFQHYGQDFDKPLGARFDKPCIVTPIEDESLPHPGDGRIWETKAGRVVEIEDVARDGWVRGRIEPEGYPSLIRAGSLRERKPEPEHTVWCWHTLQAKGCTCERRCGEDRRTGDDSRRTRNFGRRAHDRRGAHINRTEWDRRSGTDRRQP